MGGDFSKNLTFFDSTTSQMDWLNESLKRLSYHFSVIRKPFFLLDRNTKHDPEEFARQLKDQEQGMNELTVEEYLANRERYIAEGRAVFVN
ncbi:polymorphic toxin type 15 domain-containing protein [Terrilactibacillus sp. S3-3]|nr:polymorphic toxin type 15 domain-containing protein [Terrilactibacillus sp. S3-3]